MDGQEEAGNDLEEAPKTGWKGIVRESSIIISPKSHGQAIWFLFCVMSGLGGRFSYTFLPIQQVYYNDDLSYLSLTFIAWSNLVCDKISEIQLKLDGKDVSLHPNNASSFFHVFLFAQSSPSLSSSGMCDMKVIQKKRVTEDSEDVLSPLPILCLLLYPCLSILVIELIVGRNGQGRG